MEISVLLKKETTAICECLKILFEVSPLVSSKVEVAANICFWETIDRKIPKNNYSIMKVWVPLGYKYSSLLRSSLSKSIIHRKQHRLDKVHKFDLQNCNLKKDYDLYQYINVLGNEFLEYLPHGKIQEFKDVMSEEHEKYYSKRWIRQTFMAFDEFEYFININPIAMFNYNHTQLLKECDKIMQFKKVKIIFLPYIDSLENYIKPDFTI